MGQTMKNAAQAAAYLLVGRVMHERLRPVPHRFTYPVFSVRCNLARLATLDNWWFGIDRWRPLGLSRRDYGPCTGGNLEPWMRQRLADADIPADGEIWLQTMPRVFGYAFNPVSFWFCHDAQGKLRALLAEVRNTFGERHSYLLSAEGHAPIGDDTVLVCRKILHVSPFCKVEGEYTFRVREGGHHSSVAIDYSDGQGVLIRTLVGARMDPLTGARALRALLRQPLLTILVVVRIHWQALRLLLKKVPFHGRHPQPAETPDMLSKYQADASHPRQGACRRESTEEEVRP
jgi:uncharacterized protein